jgi:hypothetical protein
VRIKAKNKNERKKKGETGAKVLRILQLNDEYLFFSSPDSLVDFDRWTEIQ